MSVNSSVTYIDEDPACLPDPEHEDEIPVRDSGPGGSIWTSQSSLVPGRKDQDFGSEPKRKSDLITNDALALARTIKRCSQSELEQWWGDCAMNLGDSIAICNVVETLSKLTFGTSSRMDGSDDAHFRFKRMKR